MLKGMTCGVWEVTGEEAAWGQPGLRGLLKGTGPVKLCEGGQPALGLV